MVGQRIKCDEDSNENKYLNDHRNSKKYIYSNMWIVRRSYLKMCKRRLQWNQMVESDKDMILN